MSNLLEDTGYSYSGISDLIRNEPENKNELLLQIDDKYCTLRDKIEKLEKHLNVLKNERAAVVSCFLHFHKVLINDSVIDENVLTYQKGSQNVVIKIEDSNRIKYAYYQRADSF